MSASLVGSEMCIRDSSMDAEGKAKTIKNMVEAAEAIYASKNSQASGDTQETLRDSGACAGGLEESQAVVAPEAEGQAKST
eukprot:6706104-Alexandrium_andersonii.AAC.1